MRQNHLVGRPSATGCGIGAVLEELFKALLHKLMTGEIRVEELDISVLLGNTTQSKDAERIGNRA